MKTGSFNVSKFTNPSGEVVFRLSGWLDGRRIRKNFSTHAESEAERQFFEIRKIQNETGVRTAATRLSDEQLQQAEAVFLRLQNRPHSLGFYVDYALSNYKESSVPKLLSEVVAEFTAFKDHELEQDLISAPYLTRLKGELKRLKRHFAGATINELSGAKLLAYFERGQASHKTFNNRRGVVSALVKFAFQREWITENPISKIAPRRTRRRRGGAITFSASRAAELMAFVESQYPAAIPFFALCLFAGIRPCLRTGEILRLRPSHVRPDENLIRIDCEVSKVREARNVTIQPNLAAWLAAYPLEKFPIVPVNLQHLREKVALEFPLAHDVMRHTFISMFIGKFRSLGEAALQAGNSEGIIKKHYLDLKSRAEAEQFFGIMPSMDKRLTIAA